VRYSGSKKRKKFLRFMLFFLIIGSVLWIGYNYIENGGSLKKNVGEANLDDLNCFEVEIPMGSDTGSIANLLKSKNLIDYPIVFKIISKYKKYDGKYQSGTHKLCEGLTYQQIMDILVESPSVENDGKITIPEGFAIKQISEKIGENEKFESDKFEELLKIENFDYRFLNEISDSAIEQKKYIFEGYLFPDTYEIAKEETEKTMIIKMLDRFDEIFKDEYYERTKELGFTVDEIITIASIIEREAKLTEERKTVSSIIYNRLSSTDLRKLQVDATLQYVLLCKEGAVKEFLLNSDLKMDDPYNTYKYEKLPPGPICSPGKESIEAALYPEETEYLYYVAVGDGSNAHNFAKTYNEFLQYKKEYQENVKK
jgi:UPF0755 protein